MDPQKRVLIVEPDHGFALALASLFQEQACATRTAGSAAEAALEIANRRPSLCVVRAELPDLSGFSLCAQLRHDPVTARLPVILDQLSAAPTYRLFVSRSAARWLTEWLIDATAEFGFVS